MTTNNLTHCDRDSFAVATQENLDPIKQWCQLVATSALVPDALRGKPADVFTIVMFGLDLGFKPTQAMQWVYVVKGRPSLSAEGMRARVLTQGHEFRVVASTGVEAVVEGRRKGAEEWNRAEFTMEQAKRAGLDGDNWRKYPEDMLLARATSRLCKRFFSDVIGGLEAYEDLVDRALTAQAAALADAVAAREAPAVEAAPVPDDEIRAQVLDLEASHAVEGAVTVEEPPEDPEDLFPDETPQARTRRAVRAART